MCTPFTPFPVMTLPEPLGFPSDGVPPACFFYYDTIAADGLLRAVAGEDGLTPGIQADGVALNAVMGAFDVDLIASVTRDHVGPSRDVPPEMFCRRHRYR